MEQQVHKQHHKASAGSKFQKKKEKKEKKKLDGQEKEKGKNYKAFIGKGRQSANKHVQRNAELQEKRLHVPLADRSQFEPPPVLIAVVGPPKVGKTTLIKSLVKRYTRQTLSDTNGPITVVSGKKRRLTFFECPNDLNSMVDCAKVADLVLLLVDASFGFEMETFEFLNMCQVHGFPKIMGVLTHLDVFKNNKKLRKRKKALKQRFWTEIYQGAKLFYLSGLINEKYPKNEILNLSRFISVMKFRPLIWRNTHPYVMVDRVEDITRPELVHEDKKIDRKVSLYGYVRGCHLKSGMKVHVPGVGDFNMDDISFLPDPCPLPDKEVKTLNNKQKLLYAPMSDVGDILYDKDAVYINVPGIYSKNAQADKKRPAADESGSDSDDEGADEDRPRKKRALGGASDDSESVPHTLTEGDKMVLGLQDTRYTITDRLEESEVQIFKKSAPIKSKEIKEKAVEVEEVITDKDGVQTIGHRVRRKAVFGEDDDDEDDDDEDEGDDDDEDEDEDEDDDEDDDDDDEEGTRRGRGVRVDDRENGRHEEYEFEDTDSEFEDEDDENEEDDSDTKWRANIPTMAERSARLGRRKTNLSDVIYGDRAIEEIFGSLDEESTEEEEDNEGSDDEDGDGDDDEDEEDIPASKKAQKNKAKGGNDDDDDELFTVAKAPKTSNLNQIDTSKIVPKDSEMHDWSDDEVLQTIRFRFITGGNSAGGDEDAVDGDFEDLETGEVHKAQEEVDEAKKLEEEKKALEKKRAELKKKFIEQYDEEKEGENGKTFYEEVKEEMDKQLQANRVEFEGLAPQVRAELEGYKPGVYIRIVLSNVPAEFIENFNSKYPVIIGGLLTGEDVLGLVQARLKRHRWHPKTLKNSDPLIVSIGWRRFQTIPTYSMKDATRNRVLKYTPEHMHCTASFFGPITPPNTGFCAFQTTSNALKTFRVAATGVVLENDKSLEIVKKLKLTGEPTKVFKNTAFIKGMFNSQLEVAKFEGASLKTVSGIRGQIKKALPKPEGAFRATFEDKILMSDIVFLRAFVPVHPKKLFNPVTNLLLQDKGAWEGMKTVGMLRREMKLRAPKNVDSIYQKIERKEKRFAPLKIPKSIQAALPFATKNKDPPKKAKNAYLEKRAVVMDPEEKKATVLFQQVNTLRKEKVAKRNVKKAEAKERLVKKRAEEQERLKAKKQKEAKKYFSKKAMGKK